MEDTDIRVLPMVRFNPSGDLKWLGRNYRPQRDVRLIADEEPPAGAGPDPRGSARSPRLKIDTIGREESAA